MSENNPERQPATEQTSPQINKPKKGLKEKIFGFFKRDKYSKYDNEEEDNSKKDYDVEDFKRIQEEFSIENLQKNKEQFLKEIDDAIYGEEEISVENIDLQINRVNAMAEHGVIDILQARSINAELADTRDFISELAKKTAKEVHDSAHGHAPEHKDGHSKHGNDHHAEPKHEPSHSEVPKHTEIKTTHEPSEHAPTTTAEIDDDEGNRHDTEESTPEVKIKKTPVDEFCDFIDKTTPQLDTKIINEYKTKARAEGKDGKINLATFIDFANIYTKALDPIGRGNFTDNKMWEALKTFAKNQVGVEIIYSQPNSKVDNKIRAQVTVKK